PPLGGVRELLDLLDEPLLKLLGLLRPAFPTGVPLTHIGAVLGGLLLLVVGVAHRAGPSCSRGSEVAVAGPDASTSRATRSSRVRAFAMRSASWFAACR